MEKMTYLAFPQSIMKNDTYWYRKLKNTNATKLILALGKPTEVLCYCINLLHLDLPKIFLQCQLPVVTVILKQVNEGLPHYIWCILPMEIRDNAILNSFYYDISCLWNTFLPLSQILSICCWRLRIIIVYEFLQPIVFQQCLHPVLPRNIIWATLKGIFESQSVEWHPTSSKEWSYIFDFTCKDKLVFFSSSVIYALIPCRNTF